MPTQKEVDDEVSEFLLCLDPEIYSVERKEVGHSVVFTVWKNKQFWGNWIINLSRGRCRPQHCTINTELAKEWNWLVNAIYEDLEQKFGNIQTWKSSPLRAEQPPIEQIAQSVNIDVIPAGRQREQAILWNAGHTAKSIARHFGVSTADVYNLNADLRNKYKGILMTDKERRRNGIPQKDKIG